MALSVDTELIEFIDAEAKKEGVSRTAYVLSWMPATAVYISRPAARRRYTERKHSADADELARASNDAPEPAAA
jgi:hypothetical protein